MLTEQQIQQIRQIVRDEYRKVSTVSSNSPNFPFLSQLSGGAGTVLSPQKIGTSVVNKTPDTNLSHPASLIMPIPIINATAGSFNGGNAPIGSSLLFIKDTTKQLWFRFYSDHDSAYEWYGMDFSPGHTSNAVTVLSATP